MRKHLLICSLLASPAFAADAMNDFAVGPAWNARSAISRKNVLAQLSMRPVETAR